MKNELDERGIYVGIGYIKLTFEFERSVNSIGISTALRFNYFNETIFKPFLADYDDKSIYNNYRVFESMKNSIEDIQYRCNKIISDIFDNPDSNFYPELICKKSPYYDNIDEISFIIHNLHSSYNFSNLIATISKYVKIGNENILDIKNISISGMKLNNINGNYEPTRVMLKNNIKSIVELCRLSLEELN